MRIARLDLLRYGRFTDRVLEFPARAVDLHLLYGPNEAGKSTTQSAIEDLLFGFGAKSRYAFVHEQKALRVGALLVRGELSIEARRRKGNKDTLQGSGDIPLGDRALLPFLGSVDRDYYARMFSLDHLRLAEGGKQLLDARNDVGRLLFEAGAGLSSLRAVLARCDQEAEAIFAPRAKGRTFNIARDQLDAAEERLRADAVAAPAWQAAARTVEELRAQKSERTERLGEAQRRRRRLERIRRVLPLLGELHRLEAARTSVGRSPVLPVDAAGLLERAATERSALAHRDEALVESLAQIVLPAPSDEAEDGILAHEAALRRLSELRAVAATREVATIDAELAKRRARLATLLGELGIKTGALAELAEVERILPSRLDATRLRALYVQSVALDETYKTAEREVQRLGQERKRLLRQLSARPLGLDSAMLSKIVPRVRKAGDRTAELARLDAEAAVTALRTAQLLARLGRFSGSTEALAQLPVPSPTALAEVAAARQELLHARARFQNDQAKARAELREEELSADQLVRDRQIVSTERVQAARAERDGLWKLVKEPDHEPEMVQLFVEAVLRADQLADRRFDGVTDAAQLLAVQQRIERLYARAALLEEEGERLDQRAEQIDAQWRALWTPSGLSVGSPAEMEAWLETRALLLAHVDRAAEEAQRAERLRRDVESDKALLLSALTLAPDEAARLAEAPLDLVLAEAESRNQEVTQKEGAQVEQQRQQDQNSSELTAARRELAEAEATRSAWLVEWSEATLRVGRPREERPEATGAALDVLDELREEARQARELHERSQKMAADLARFAAEAEALAREVGTKVAASPEATTDSLVERFAEARERRTRRLELERQRAEQLAQRHKLAEARALVEARLDELLRATDSKTVEEARAVIVRASERQRLDGEHERAAQRLNEAGDGLPQSELEAECADVDRDQLPSELETLIADIDAENAALTDLNVTLAAATEALAKIDGGTRASDAVQDRQLASAELEAQAERHVQLRTQALLLRWVIDRYRQEKQAPLLRRASQLFGLLTDGAFSELRVDLDDQDRALLVGVKGERAVEVEGMSTGSVDQLYLALRLAAIEDYLDRSPPLPLVIDDLFVQFDDQRALAGLRALAQIARRTQVLVFTHHPHLVELARTLDLTSVINL